MAVFSTNQNRQLYVVSALKDSATEVATAGDVAIKTLAKDKTGKAYNEVYLVYQGADSAMRSDLIDVHNIEYVKKTVAADMEEKLKVVKVTFSEEHGDTPLSGQDYVLRIAFRQFYGMSDEDQYFKFGAVHGTANMTAETFWTKMAESLTKNFSKELGSYLTFKGDATGLTITEVEQPWHLGTMQQERVIFEVYPTTVYLNGDEVVWGTTAVSEGDAIKNGKKIADLEYFCMGERGDIYRMKGWPRVIPTTYLVDASKEYDVLDIHYSFRDTGTSSYKSEKDITLVEVAGGTVLDSIKTALETALA